MNSQLLKSRIEKYDLMDLANVDGTFYFNPMQFAASEDAHEENKRKFRTIGATNTPTLDGRQIDHETSLPNFAVDAEADGGKPIMINHDLYGGAESLPIGRTYSGSYNAELRQFLAKFWIDDLEAVEQGQRVIAGIDSGSITDVSIGGRGKFNCSFCGQRMGWFGCANGHYPLMKVMVDKDGEETDDPDKMVETIVIYALFVDAHLLELSIAYAGAISDAKIIDAYSEVIDKASELYKDGVFSETDLQTFSCFTDLYSAVNTNQQFNLGGIQMAGTNLKPLGELETIDVEGLEAQFTDLNAAPEVLAIFSTLTAQITKQQGYLRDAYAAYAEKVADLGDETTQQKLQAAAKQVADMKTEVQRLKQCETKADAADKFTEVLRTRLKAAKKREIGVSQEEKDTFYTQVDGMTDLSAMFLALSALESSNQSASEFLENITGSMPSDSEEVHSDSVLERAAIRQRASYR